MGLSLTTEDFNICVDIIAPHIGDDHITRRSRVTEAFPTCTRLIIQIDYGGDARTFATNLLYKFTTFGICNEGEEETLIAFLGYVSLNLVGVEQRRELERIINNLLEEPVDTSITTFPDNDKQIPTKVIVGETGDDSLTDDTVFEEEMPQVVNQEEIEGDVHNQDETISDEEGLSTLLTSTNFHSNSIWQYVVLNFSQWAKLPELYTDTIPFQTNESRNDFIERVNFLKLDDRLRLVGGRGIGKTRLALEAIRANHLQGQTIYFPKPEIFDVNLFASSDLPDELVVVVDDCKLADTRRIWQLVRHTEMNCHLITIETHATPPFHPTIPTFELGLLSNVELSRIVDSVYESHGEKSHRFGDDRAAYSDEYVRGDVKLLIAFVKAFLEHPEIEGIARLTDIEDLETLVNRMLPQNQTAVRTLQALSIMKSTGINWDTTGFVKWLADLVGLSIGELKMMVQELVRDGIVVRDSYFHQYTLVPKLLAIRLASQVWRANIDTLNTYLDSQNRSFNEISPILLRLGEIGDRSLAKGIVDRLLYRINSENEIVDNVNLIASVGLAEPLSVCNFLNQRLDNVASDNLRILAVHPQLLNMLSSALRVRKSYFPAIRVLAWLATAVEASNQDNAQRRWKSNFFLLHGANPATIDERNQVILQLLQHEEKSLKLVAIQAIGATLNNDEWGVVSHNSTGYISSKPWWPELWRDVWGARRKVLELLDQAKDDSDVDVSKTAWMCLITHAHYQLPALFEDVMDRLRQFPQNDSIKLELWKVLSDILIIYEKKLDEEQLIQIRDFRNDVITDGYHDQLLKHIADNPQRSRTGFDNYREYLDSLDGRIKELATEWFNYPNPNSELEWLIELPNQYPYSRNKFAAELGRLDKERSFYENIHELSVKLGHWHFLLNYLHGRVDAQDAQWVVEQCKTLLQKQADPLVLNVLTRNDMPDEGVRLLLDHPMLKVSEIPWNRNRIENGSLSLVRDILDRLVDEETITAHNLGIWMVYNRLRVKPDDLDELQPQALALLALANSLDEERSQMEWHVWHEVALLYCQTNPIEITDIALPLLTRERWSYDREEIWEVLHEALKQSSKDVWGKIGNHLLQKYEDQKYYLRYAGKPELNIFEGIDTGIVIDWAKKSSNNAPMILAYLSSRLEFPMNDVMKKLIIEFESHEDMLRTLGSEISSPTGVQIWSGNGFENRFTHLRDEVIKWRDEDHPAVKRWVEDFIRRIDIAIAES